MAYLHPLLLSVLLVLGSIETAPAVELPDLTGDLKLNFTRILDGGGNVTGYQFTGFSIDVEFESHLPLLIPVAIRGDQLGKQLYWSQMYAWDNPILALNPACEVLSLVENVVEGAIPIKGTLDLYDALRNSGPTEQTVTLIPIDLSPLGAVEIFDLPVDLSCNAGLALKYDVTLPTGTNIAIDQRVVLERLTIQHGANLIGDPQMIIRTDLVNSGYIGNLSGTIQGDFYNNGNPANNERAYISGTLNVNGQLYNTGEIRVASGRLKLLPVATSNTHDGSIAVEGGSFQYGTTFDNYGTFELRNGGLEGTGEFLNAANGQFIWQGGSLPQNVTNTGTWTVTGTGTKKISSTGVFNSSGTVKQTGTAMVTLTGTYTQGRAVLNNLLGGVYDIQGDGDIVAQDYGGIVNNAGTFRKSAGMGESLLDNWIYLNNTGTVEVNSGTLTLQSGGTSNAGAFLLGNTGRVRFTGGTFAFSGVNAISNNGAFECANGHVQVNEGSVTSMIVGSGGSLEVNGGELNVNGSLEVTGTGLGQFTAGNIGGGGTITCSLNTTWSGGAIVGRLNTTGTWTVTGTGTKKISSTGVFNSSGTVKQTGTAMVTLTGTYTQGRAVLNNLLGGVYDIQGDGDIVAQDYGGIVNNAGTFRKSAGMGESLLDNWIYLNNTGTVEVNNGPQAFPRF